MAGKSSSERRGTRSTPSAGPNLAPSNTSTQIAKSHKSRVIAASVLATKNDMFKDWASVVKVQLAIETKLPDTAIFGVIKTLQARSLVFPEWLKQLDSRNWSMPHAYKKWKDKICSKLNGSTRGKYSFDEYEGRELDSGFPFAMGIIAQLCHHQERVESNATRIGLTSETDLRFLLDGLIMHGCDGDGDKFLIYSTEQKLKLPEIKPSKISKTVNVVTTTADGVTSLDINDFKPYTLLADDRAAMSSFSTKDPTLRLILVHCVVEYKRAGKRVLGIQQQFAFGIFQHSGDGLQVVAGIWEGDIIKLYRIGRYSLRDPVSLIEFHLLLLGMKRLAAEYKQQLMDSSNTLLSALEAESPTHKWATPETRGTSTIPETPEEQDHPPQHGGGSSFQHGLSTLGRWDIVDRIYAFNESIRNCDPCLLWQANPWVIDYSDSSDNDSVSPLNPLISNHPGNANNVLEENGGSFVPKVNIEVLGCGPVLRPHPVPLESDLAW